MISATPQEFRRWLDQELFRRFGRAKSNRSICIEAGLPENALYRVLTKGAPPSAQFIARMAAYLKLSPDELARHAGSRPLLTMASDGQVTGQGELTPAEKHELRRSLDVALAALRG
jgi:hypothetical protein